MGVFFFVFFFSPASLHALVSNGMRVDYKAEKGTALKESVQLTLVDEMTKPLSIESWRNGRGRRASEVKIERPKLDVGQHAVCIQSSETYIYCPARPLAVGAPQAIIGRMSSFIPGQACT